jgi:membrane protease YdiL (CAAX protease family)
MPTPDASPEAPAMAGLEGAESTPSAPPASVAVRHLRLAGRALISLLVGGVAIVGPVLAWRQVLLPLVEIALRPGPEALGGLRRGGILLAAIAGYLAYVRWHEQRSAVELRPRPLGLVLGGVGGALLAAVPIALLFVTGTYERVAFRGFAPELAGVAGLIGIAATLEELVYRGLVLQVLERAWGTGVALAAQAVVFALPHLENLEQASGREASVLLVSVALLGLLWGALFVRTRNLWVVAANHAAWNFTILSSGVPLSGIEDWRTLAPFETRLHGADWLTGGRFGPESSVLVIVSVAIAVVLLRRGSRVPRAAPPSP